MLSPSYLVTVLQWLHVKLLGEDADSICISCLRSTKYIYLVFEIGVLEASYIFLNECARI